MVVGFPNLSKQPPLKALASQASLSNPLDEIDSTPEKGRRGAGEAPEKPRGELDREEIDYGRVV